MTDSAGNFTIPRLSPDLYFELLVVHDGYVPTFVKKVDPTKPAPTPVLKLREAVTDPRRLLRGSVVDAHHNPIRDAVVQPQGILVEMPNGGRSSRYFGVPGLDPVAVTNDKGEFELAHAEPFDAMALQVEARAMAPKIVVGYPLPEIRIGTNDDGTFAITNVPPAVDWYLYGKMESLAARGAAPIIEWATKRDGGDVDLGDLSIMPAFHLRGKVVLSDGKPMPAGMRVTVSADRAADSQTTVLSSDGAFEFSGLAKGSYTIFASVEGYRLTSSGSGSIPLNIPLTVEHDVSDFVMTLDPQ